MFMSICFFLKRIQWQGRLFALLSILLSGGCATYQYEARPLDSGQIAREFTDRTLADSGLKEYLAQYEYTVNQWPLAEWDINALTLAAYYFHPNLQVAIREYNKANIHMEFVNQRPNPEISIPLEYHSDTEDGKSPWTIGLLFDFILERPAKRQARYDQAVAGLDAARININSVAWDIYSELRRQYFNYQSVSGYQGLLLKQKEYAEQNMQLLNRRLELGQASEFEISSMQLELQRIRLELTSHKVTVVEAWHALAASVGIPATALDNIQFTDASAEYFNQLQELEYSELQSIALTQRLDIQKALADYTAHEAQVRLEIEKQYPDLTLSPGFLFDQHDNIWQLGVSWILPLFHPQNEGPIQEALAEREIKQAEFLALQSRVINEVSSAYSGMKAQLEALNEAEQLLQEVKERNLQIERQYKLGYADHLQLSRSLLEVAAVEKAVSDLKYSVISSAGRLEDKLQYPIFSKQAYQYLYGQDVNKNNHN